MNRLGLLVEGDGDVQAAPVLLSRLLDEMPVEKQGLLFVDPLPLRIGGIHQLTGKRSAEWEKKLGVAKKRPRTNAVLLLLDGDQKRLVEGKPFCAAGIARELAARAKATGAGANYSVAIAFLHQEYESLLIASYSSLKRRKDGVAAPDIPESSPRDAKGWLAKNLEGGYKETRHQAALTRELDLALLRASNHRSFKRLVHALEQLVDAIRTDQHIATP